MTNLTGHIKTRDLNAADRKRTAPKAHDPIPEAEESRARDIIEDSVVLSVVEDEPPAPSNGLGSRIKCWLGLK